MPPLSKLPELNGSSNGSGWRAIALNLLMPALLIIIAVCDMPIQQTFEFDNDEGINLMKAFLYWKGFDLYGEVWNDQPPFLTAILSQWYGLIGPSVFASRLLILLFSALLIWSFYQTLKIFLGRIAAAVGSLLLILSWSFLKLSVAVMIGLPALSLAMTSIYVLALFKQKPARSLLIISGCLFALSIQTKLFTVFLIPLLVILWFDLPNVNRANVGIDRSKRSLKQQLVNVLIWLGTLLTVYVALGILFRSFNYEQLLQSHMEESIKDEFDATNGVQYLFYMLRQDYDIGLLAIAGTFAFVSQKQWAGLLPLTWLLTAFLLLLNHRPIWYHHYLLISIPMAWLAAYGVAVAVDFLSRKDWFSDLKAMNKAIPVNQLKALILPGLAILLLTISVAMIPVKLSSSWGRPSSQWEIVEILKSHREQTRWVFSDRPIIPFYAQLPVPPELAVLSQKRFASGNFTYDNLLEILQHYRPEQIVLARRTKDLKSHPGIRRFLRENYSRTFSKAYSRSNPDAISEHYLIKTYSEFHSDEGGMGVPPLRRGYRPLHPRTSFE